MSQAVTRRIWMATHRYVGLVTCLFLTIAAVTGCVLSFERPLDAWLNPELFNPRVPGSADPIAAVGRLEREHPELVAAYFPARARPGRNLVVAVEPRPGGPPLAFDQAFLDGGDGRLVGVRRVGPGWDRAHLMRGVFLLHYTLLAGAPGRWLFGAVAIAWLISNLVGVYLTWPARGPYLKRWGQAFGIRWPGALPRVLLDLHRASGLWLLLPLTVLAFTSGAMNFFGEAVTPAVQVFSPPRPSPFDATPPAHAQPRRLGFADALARAEVLAAADRPGWRPAVLQYEADRNLMGVRITRSGQEGYRGLGPVSYWFDGATGRFVYLDDPYRDSAGQKLIRALYPLHTGQMIGVTGIALDVVLGLVTAGSCITGVYLWLKRRPGRVAARRAGR